MAPPTSPSSVATPIAPDTTLTMATAMNTVATPWYRGAVEEERRDQQGHAGDEQHGVPALDRGGADVDAGRRQLAGPVDVALGRQVGDAAHDRQEADTEQHRPPPQPRGGVHHRRDDGEDEQRCRGFAVREDVGEGDQHEHDGADGGQGDARRAQARPEHQGDEVPGHDQEGAADEDTGPAAVVAGEQDQHAGGHEDGATGAEGTEQVGLGAFLGVRAELVEPVPGARRARTVVHVGRERPAADHMVGPVLAVPVPLFSPPVGIRMPSARHR